MEVINMNNIKFVELAISNGWTFQTQADCWTAEHSDDNYDTAKELCENENLLPVTSLTEWEAFTPEQLESLHKDGSYQYNHHWTFFYDEKSEAYGGQEVYSMTYDGNYEEFSTSLDKLMGRNDQLISCYMAFGTDLVKALEYGEEKDDVINCDGCFLLRLFNTEEEKKAYLMGIADGEGWNATLELCGEQADKYSNQY